MLVVYFLLSSLTLINARPQEPNSVSCQPDQLDLVPHMWDCTKYYNCQSGQREPEEKECALGTHFSFIVQACVDPKEVSCTSNLVESENKSSKESYDEVALMADECPSGSSVYLLFPHETDCSLYYQCVHGRMVLRQCAPGTHFDVKYQRCNWPWAAGCELGGGDDSETKESEEDSVEDVEDGDESEGDAEGGEDSDNETEKSEENGQSEENSDENGNASSNETNSKEDDSDENDNSKSSEDSSSEKVSSAEGDKIKSSLSVAVGVNLQMSKLLKA